MRIKRILFALASVLLCYGRLSAQASRGATPNDSVTNAPKLWSFSLTADGYVVPHAEFFVSPIFTADHSRLHLEARYNYEGLSTGSLWVGYNFSVGHKLVLDVTPMVGGVFGHTTGVAPGYEVSLSYKKISFSSTGEYFFDARNLNGSFFYSWPQVTYSPADWFRLGFVAQRTKAYHTSLDTQRGLLVGFSPKKVQFTTYVFNLGWTSPALVFELEYSF